MLEQYTNLEIFHFFLVFCRVGTAMMLLPGFGEVYVSPQIKLSAALAVSFVMTFVLGPTLPPLPADSLALFLLVVSEIIIGGFIGSIARMIQGSLHVAGMIFAFQSSLASALLFDANQGSQGSVLGNFMTILGLTLVFATDLHHLFFAGISDSYILFKAGEFPPVTDLLTMAVKVVSAGFSVAVKISAPLIVIGTCLYLAAGLMSRLMPSMQVFFIIVPLQLYVSFAVILVALSGGMLAYLHFFEDTMRVFIN